MAILDQANYIKHVLISEIGDVVDNHKWLSFILICSAIEFLGGCIDTKEKNLHTIGQSKKRFNSAIITLFPTVYHKYISTEKGKQGLYEQLRCGLNHVTLPGLNIALSERNSQLENLSIWNDGVNDRLILIAEDFYDDFKNACDRVVKMLENGEISKTFFIQV